MYFLLEVVKLGIDFIALVNVLSEPEPVFIAPYRTFGS